MTCVVLTVKFTYFFVRANFLQMANCEMSDIMYYHCFHVTESSLLGKYHSEMLGIVTGTRFDTR
jgi:hypothetical protein